MAIVLGKTSRARGATVHPDLWRVVLRAAEMALPEEDFSVLQGVRTREEMMVNYGKGRTASQVQAKGIPAKYAQPGAAKVTWLTNPFMSNHRPQADGKSIAIDLGLYPMDWDDNARWERLALLMFKAAAKEKVLIRWGRDWDMDGRYMEKGETDGPHFELVR